MIGLARSQDVDPRFFLPMPKAPPSKVCTELNMEGGGGGGCTCYTSKHSIKYLHH